MVTGMVVPTMEREREKERERIQVPGNQHMAKTKITTYKSIRWVFVLGGCLGKSRFRLFLLALVRNYSPISYSAYKFTFV